MSDKKRLIVTAAQRVFARKGYRAASMQEIAGEAGVAKGSIYLHFRSKDELALAAVADVYDRVRRRMAELEADEGLTPRERFVRQLEEQLAVGEDNAEWIRRLWHEHAAGLHEASPGFILRIRAETSEWLERSIRSIYGHACAPYAGDIALMMQGALAEIIGCHLLGGKPLEPQRISRYLVRRMDDIAGGLAGSRERPLVAGDEFNAIIRGLAGGRGPAERLQAIRELRERLEAAGTEGRNPRDAGDSQGPADSRDAGDSQDPADSRDAGDSQGPADSRDAGNSRGPRDSRDAGNSQDLRDSRNAGDSQDPADSRDAGNSQDLRDSRNAGDSQGPRDSRDAGDSQGPADSRDAGNSQGPRDSRDAGDSQAPADSRDAGDSHGSRDSQVTRNSQDPRDSRDAQNVRAAVELDEALALLESEASKMLPNRVLLRAVLGHVRALAPEPVRPEIDKLERELLPY